MTLSLRCVQVDPGQPKALPRTAAGLRAQREEMKVELEQQRQMLEQV